MEGKRKYRILKFCDREIIEARIKEGKSIDSIAEELGVHRDTIYKEFRRVNLDRKSYSAIVAQKSI